MFYHVWALRPSWSEDLDQIYKPFSLHLEAHGLTKGTYVRATNDRRRWGSAVPDVVPYPGASPSRRPASQGN